MHSGARELHKTVIILKCKQEMNKIVVFLLQGVRKQNAVSRSKTVLISTSFLLWKQLRFNWKLKVKS